MLEFAKGERSIRRWGSPQISPLIKEGASPQISPLFIRGIKGDFPIFYSEVQFLNSLPLFGVTLAAIDRPSFGWFEGDLGLGSALGTRDRVHLAGAAAAAVAAAISASCRPALWTTAGLVL